MLLLCAPTGEQCIARVKQIRHGIGIENLGGIVTEFDSENELYKPGFDLSHVARLRQPQLYESLLFVNGLKSNIL